MAACTLSGLITDARAAVPANPSNPVRNDRRSMLSSKFAPRSGLNREKPEWFLNGPSGGGVRLDLDVVHGGHGSSFGRARLQEIAKTYLTSRNA